MANADRVALRFIEEDSFGNSPSVNATGLTLTTTQASRRYAAGSGTPFEDLQIGQLVIIAGLVNGDSNGYHIVEDVDPSGVWFEVVEAIGADEAAVAACSVLTALKELRFTSEGLMQETDSVESNEIRDDRQVSEVPRTSIRGAGDLAFEFSYGAYDDFLKSTLEAAAWSTVVTIGPIVTISAAVGDNSYNDSGTGFGSIVANQWIYVTGFADAANNGFSKVVSATTAKIIVEGRILATEAATPSITLVMGGQIVNGVIPKTYTMEKEYNDLLTADSIAKYEGMQIDTFALELGAEAIITGTFGFIGKNESSESASIGDGTPQPSAQNRVMNGIDHVVSILENLSEIDANAFTIALSNNVRERSVIGVLGADSLGEGKISVTGTLQMYFETKAIMDKYLNYSNTNLAFVLQDDAGNSYVVDLPRVQFTSGQRVAGGKNTDVIADMAFSAYADTEEDITIRIARFAA